MPGENVLKTASALSFADKTSLFAGSFSGVFAAVCRSDSEHFVVGVMSGSGMNVHALTAHAWRMKYNALILRAKVRLSHR